MQSCGPMTSALARLPENLSLAMKSVSTRRWDLMAQNQSLDFSQLGLALLNGAGYFGLGLLIFHGAERRAKCQGILGGY